MYCLPYQIDITKICAELLYGEHSVAFQAFRCIHLVPVSELLCDLLFPRKMHSPFVQKSFCHDELIHAHIHNKQIGPVILPPLLMTPFHSMHLSSYTGWLMKIPWCVALSRWEARLLRCSLHFLCEDLCFSCMRLCSHSMLWCHPVKCHVTPWHSIM